MNASAGAATASAGAATASADAAAAEERARGRAVAAARLCAVDPHGLGGISLRSSAGAARDAWLANLRACLPDEAPVRRVPVHVTDERLLGGIDLPATLRAGRPVAQRGLLAEADGGLLVLAMAERVSSSMAARVGAVLDAGEFALERDGLAARVRTRFGVVALDEGLDADERPPAALLERLAFHVEMPPARAVHDDEDANDADAWPSAADVAAARERLPRVRIDDATVEALCGVAGTLGIESLRVATFAVRAARAAAALDGRTVVEAEDATLAGQLVFGPRARRLPEAPEDDAAPPPAPPEPPSESASGEDASDATPPQDLPPLEDLVLAAAQAAMPAGLLDALKIEVLRTHAKTSGAAGALQKSGLRGRPGPARRGEPRGGARLNVVETLRAAAPWQRIRRAQMARASAATGRVLVRVEDFHVTRHQARAETTTVFVVDASGSSALHRLAEAKGAVELLLADCYVRRDRVAVIAFRGQRADLLLPPTRSLVRAKRSLAGLPGGGGTPLASGLEAATSLVDAVQRRGGTPTIVLLTDGRANVARDGSHQRARAEQDAIAAARRLRGGRVAALLVDTAPRPQPFARELAAALGGHYLPLPYADASMLQRAVQAATGG